jgi:hypothetical protein
MTEEDKKKNLDKAKRVLELAVQKEYYGKVTFSIEKGNIIVMKEEKVTKM